MFSFDGRPANLADVLSRTTDFLEHWPSDSPATYETLDAAYLPLVAAAVAKRVEANPGELDDIVDADADRFAAMVRDPAVAAICLFLPETPFPGGTLRYLRTFLQPDWQAPPATTLRVETADPCRLVGSTRDQWHEAPAEPASFHETAQRNVDDAVSFLREYCPGALQFVLSQTRFVVPRPHDTLGSATALAFPGRTILFLPAEGASPGRIAENLVHEAIHTCLYKIEALSPWIVDASGWSTMIRSPWSGNAISAHAYAHACFVWFGLYRLWTHIGAVRQHDALGEERIRCSTKGFLSGAAVHLAQERGIVRPVIEACEEIEARVKAALETGGQSRAVVA